MGNSSSTQEIQGGGEQSNRSGQPQHRIVRPPTLQRRSDLLQSQHQPSRPQSQLVISDNEDSVLSPSYRPTTTEPQQAQPGHSNDVDDNMYEGDDRPFLLPHGEEFRPRSPTNHLSRSASTMSRLGSRLLPDSVMRNLLLSGEETAEEGEALRQGVVSRRRTSVWERRTPSLSNERFSIGSTIRRHIESRTESRRRTIRGPFPLGHSDHQLLQAEPTNSLGLESSSIGQSRDTHYENELVRRPTRLSRIRNSLSLPVGGIFGTSRDRRGIRHMPRSPTPHPGYSLPGDMADQLAPSNTLATTHSDGDGIHHELDAVEPGARNMLSSSRVTSGMSTIRRIPHGFRSRSRLIRRGEHPPLSHVLQLAAAAIAAQLGGQSSAGADGLRTLGGEAFDGSIQNFVQTLQDAASAQAGEDIDMNSTDGDLPPVNFMRVFQFPNDENGTPMPHLQARESDGIDGGPSNVIDGDRSVTLVLVGVRSMPSGQDAGTAEPGGSGPTLDNLLSLPFLPPATMLNNGGSGALFRRMDTRTRASRRHSMTNFPAQYENQRHHRTRSAVNRPLFESSNTASNHNLPISISESPPGPHPPPSTPADVRSGHATPIRRPSSASGVHTPSLPDLEEDNVQGPSMASAGQPFTPRQRRRSDSEFARRPDLGSGAARRNGMVEPDRPVISPGRSWLIYVVGTNVSPDHPAFTMPSLFTDNPTYEDMQMLSNLLGPVKPPVATQEDINVAGGLYRLTLRNNVLNAEPVSESEHRHVITLTAGDRCLICLCEYEVAEEVRQLDACRHVFHRECIDEWLTTGRNSCPMCRGQGVREGTTPSTAPAVGGSAVP